MQSLRVGLSMCAVAMAAMLGCDDGADGASTESGATQCSIVDHGSGWLNQSFAEQTGRFHVEFDATPTGPNIDTVVGLSNGPATRWTSLAAIVRFNPQGYIDVRAGNVYRADHPYRYNELIGLTWRFRMDIDVATRTYSVWLKTEHSHESWSLLARDYPFRTEQASVAGLNNVAAFTNPQTSAAGGVQLCGFVATRDATTADSCVINTAGSGFATVPVAGTDGALVVRFSAIPAQANLDGVVGVGDGPIAAYNDFAASIRFFTNGMIEARDGDVYRADVAVPYRAGAQYQAKLVIDIPTKTYSVYVHQWEDWDAPVLLARGYRFRPQQAGVARLDHAGAIIASSTGRLATCRIANDSPPSLRYLRDGHYDALPLANNVVLLSDGARTHRVDASGVTTATLNVGGRLAVDAAGNLYVARVFSGVLAVESYTSSFAHRWTRTANAIGDLGVLGVHEGVVMAATAGAAYRFATDGTQLPTVPTRVVAIGPTAYVVVRDHVDAVSIDAYRGDHVLWSRTFAGQFYIGGIAVGPDGSVAFGGEFNGTVDFGDGEMVAWSPDGPRNPYIVALDPEGVLRFSRHLSGTSVVSVATDGARIVSSIRDVTQFPWVTMAVHDTAGNVVRYWAEQGWGIAKNGYPGDVVLAPTGRIYFNFDPMPYWTIDRVTWPYFAAIDL